MNRKQFRGLTGESCSTAQSAAGMAVKKLSCELELKNLGRKPKHVSHDHNKNVQQHIANGTSELEHMHALIDYKDNNNVIKKKMMTVYDAACKNNALQGSGIAWARVGS